MNTRSFAQHRNGPRPLTTRQAEVLAAVQKLFAARPGAVPSHAEIAAELGTTVSGMLSVLGSLATKGYIQLEGGLRVLRGAEPHPRFSEADVNEQTTVIS